MARTDGRANVTWKPELAFTDQTLLYASYAHGYKAGGANPPGVIPVTLRRRDLHLAQQRDPAADLRAGVRRRLRAGHEEHSARRRVTLNADVFLYNYKGYQVSEIVDRTAVNRNFDATVGAPSSRPTGRRRKT